VIIVARIGKETGPLSICKRRAPGGGVSGIRKVGHCFQQASLPTLRGPVRPMPAYLGSQYT